jgi:serine phosphatase RsbU (regulator of sigma subunit)
VSIAIDNVRLYAREHVAALTLQRSLLPRLPKIDGFDIAARYEPSAAEVGGDWYDVLHLPTSGDLGLAIGDVMGHDLAAAASMGQLRSVLRSYAWSGDSPSTVLARLDELVQALDMAALATCIYAIVRRGEREDCRISYSSAGHLPGLLRRPDGSVQRLDQALTTPIGAGLLHTAPEADIAFPAGATLVLYTDGILERRDRDIDACLDHFQATLAGTPIDADAETIAATLIADAPSGDDACVLVVRRPLD